MLNLVPIRKGIKAVLGTCGALLWDYSYIDNVMDQLVAWMLK